jgi:hypothetical protein
MPAGGPLDPLPLWGIFLVTVAVILLSIEGGFRLGQYRRRHSEGEDKPPVGEMVAATLGLLGVHPRVHVRAGRFLVRRAEAAGRRRGQRDRDDVPARGDAPRAPPVGRPEPPPGIRGRPAGGREAGQAGPERPPVRGAARPALGPCDRRRGATPGFDRRGPVHPLAERNDRPPRRAPARAPPGRRPPRDDREHLALVQMCYDTKRHATPPGDGPRRWTPTRSSPTTRAQAIATGPPSPGRWPGAAGARTNRPRTRTPGPGSAPRPSTGSGPTWRCAASSSTPPPPRPATHYHWTNDPDLA